jgi:predicted kinase
MYYVATIGKDGFYYNKMWTLDRENALDRAHELLDAGYKVIFEEGNFDDDES